MNSASQELIQIACAANGNYLPHAATMLASLFKHHSSQPLSIHLFHDSDSSQDQLAQLRNWAALEKKHLLTMHRIEGELPAALPINSRFSVAAWFRVLLPRLLPDLNKIIYLDVDLVISDSLLPLWQQPLAGNLVAAAQNPLYPLMDRRPIHKLSLKSISDYFNSGVLLMNLTELRRFNLENKVFDIAQKNPDMTRYADQEPLNAVLNGKVLPLHPRWNLQNSYFDLTKAELEAASFSSEQVFQALVKPAVIHFSGPYKPWQLRCNHPYKSLYWDYRHTTPFASATIHSEHWLDRYLRHVSNRQQVDWLLKRQLWQSYLMKLINALRP